MAIAPLIPLLAACSEQPLAPPPPPPAPEVPVLPVGLDAYRQWERLPVLRFGVRAAMMSTFDRKGGNEAADASHFLRQDADDRNVVLDVEGPGVLYFARANHWHGSPWHYGVDGVDHVIAESSTADPDNPVAGSVFLPEAALPSPLTFTWSVTRGADLNWVPIPFAESLSIAYGRTHYGTGYFIHHRFPEGAENLSMPITAWDESPPDPAVLAWLGSAGADLAPVHAATRVDQGVATIPSQGSMQLLSLTQGPSRVRAIRLKAPEASAVALSRASLRVTWDDRDAPSIDAPIGLFFGSGSLYNRDQKTYLVQAQLIHVRFEGGMVSLVTNLPMPFSSGARFELVGAGEEISDVAWEVVTEPLDEPFAHTGYFHATFVDHQVPVPGRDLVLLDTTLSEGGGEWCGHVAGTSITFSDQAALGTLEGDPRFFFDDSQSPQGHGTGTEEWSGGGDYWGGQTMTLPFAGHPAGAPSAANAQGPEDLIESAYRLLLADVMPFGKNAKVTLEHGGHNDSVEHYRTVTYWYGRPGACLIRTDELHVGDVADEALHEYVSPTAGEVVTVTSRFPLGVDHVGATEVIPEVTDTGRVMTGTSEFVLQIDPNNVGVMLRRRLDYAFADQRAEVLIGDAAPGSALERAGNWYTAGSTTNVYSNPPAELGPAEHTLQTSDRRLREEEMLLPPKLTKGKSAIRVRVTMAPKPRPIIPGGPPPEVGWSEMRYWAYSYLPPG